MGDEKAGGSVVRGAAVEMGDIDVIPIGRKRPHVVERSILIQFDSEEDVRRAIREKRLEFTVYGEGPKS